MSGAKCMTSISLSVCMCLCVCMSASMCLYACVRTCVYKHCCKHTSIQMQDSILQHVYMCILGSGARVTVCHRFRHVSPVQMSRGGGVGI